MTSSMRQIILDTETTGLEVSQGHRIIEIGCVEIERRRLTGRHYHQYLQPDREIDAGALGVHGISAEFLRDKPRFREVVDEFLDFIRGAELVIHNAPFDIGFLRNEVRLLERDPTEIAEFSAVVDTLVLARSLHPGQKNNLDALCKRYQIDNTQRTLHGALLDAEILADVYLAMTGGQSDLMLGHEKADAMVDQGPVRRLSASRPRLPVVRASAAETALHEKRLDAIDRDSGGACLWRSSGADAS